MDLNSSGSVASIIGTVISIAVLIQAIIVKSEIKKLQARHLFKIRSPQHLKKLDNYLSNLNTLLQDFSNNGDNIESTLSCVNAELKSLANKTEDKDILKQIKKSLRMNSSILIRGLSCRFTGLCSFYPFRANRESVWKSYKHLQFTHTMLLNLIEDNKRSIK